MISFASLTSLSISAVTETDCLRSTRPIDAVPSANRAVATVERIDPEPGKATGVDRYFFPGGVPFRFGPGIFPMILETGSGEPVHTRIAEGPGLQRDFFRIGLPAGFPGKPSQDPRAA